MFHTKAAQLSLFKEDETCPKCGHKRSVHLNQGPHVRSSCSITWDGAYVCGCSYYNEEQIEEHLALGFVYGPKPWREPADGLTVSKGRPEGHWHDETRRLKPGQVISRYLKARRLRV